jgi:hypothetical protein
MATKSKEAKKTTKTAINKKGKLVSIKGAKTAPKKAVAKKTAAKKKVAPVKAVSKTKVVSKTKSAGIRKPVGLLNKKAAPEKTIVKKPAVAKKIVQEERTEEINLPPVEEKSPEIIPVMSSPAPGMDTKLMQKEAVRHYDNHNTHLSNKKGGIRPSGKKPLW